MKRRSIGTVFAALVSTLALCGLAGSASAQDVDHFLVRLGQDTTAVENVTRTANRVEVDQLGRAPRAMRRHFVYDYANGACTHVSMVAQPPGAAAPTQTIDARFVGDSLHLEIKTGAAPLQSVNVAVPKGALLVASSSPWSGYETTFMAMTASKAAEAKGTMYFLGSPSTVAYTIRKVGRDSVELSNDHQDVFRAKLDKAGHILGVLPISGTGKFSVERLAALDVDAMATGFAAREQAGAGLGTLSPRDTVRVATATGAMLWVDYGRPGKRGRTIFGSVVPYGEVWRTGANAATQFKTDKALDFGGTVVPAGFYTLWTIPSPTGWKLVFNDETGQWGTEHKTAHDKFTVDMPVTTLTEPAERFTISIVPTAAGGTLNFDWDTTRASAAFTVQP